MHFNALNVMVKILLNYELHNRNYVFDADCHVHS